MNEMLKCYYEEFEKFIDNYPNKLIIDINYMYDPPCKSWNDFTLGNWPDSVVASCSVFTISPYYIEDIKDYIFHEDGICSSDWRIIKENKNE